MADEMLPVEAGGADTRAQTTLTKLTGFVALLGGLLALAVAILVTTSVLGRWLFNTPIEGDFEFVKMATAIAVFAYLPYTQARRGNIMVDTFTAGLRPSRQHRIDAFWDFTYAAFIGFLTFALLAGTLDSIRSGETTMQRQILIWPGIGLCMLLSGLLCASAFASGIERLKRARATGEPS